MMIRTITVFLLLCPMISHAQKASRHLQYPISKKQNVVDLYFGNRVVDQYRWLEDPNSDETKNWIASQNVFTEAYLNRIPFRKNINDRLVQLWNYPKRGIPHKDGNHYFQLRNSGLQNQSVLYYCDKSDGDYTVFLDPNNLTLDGTIALKNYKASNDGNYFAYGLSTNGSDWTDIHIKSFATNEVLPDLVQWAKFSSLSWYKDGFFYHRFDEPVDEQKYSSVLTNGKIYYHRIGKPQVEDRLVYSDPQHPKRNFDTFVTDDERYLIIYGSEGTSGNMLLFRNLSIPNSLISMIVDNFDNDHLVIGNVGEELLVLTNYDAPNFRLVRINPTQSHPRNWTDVIPESEHILKDVRFSGGKLFANHLVNARSKVTIYQIDGSIDAEIALPSFCTVTLGKSHPIDQVLHYSITGFAIPTAIYKYDMSESKSELVYSSKANFNSDDYVTEQVWYKGKDGTKIPMFVVHKHDFVADGTNPVLLYGYGGFNYSLTPHFSLFYSLFLENNGIIAFPNIRGGGEYGEYWHKMGTKKLKQTTFDDFIAAAEYLVENKFCHPDKIAIKGESNGGLLIGACMTQRPELFKVALPGSGVLDMLRYQKFTIGWAWASDYGSVEVESEYKALHAYSPLHNIKPLLYPATFITASVFDDRVVPAHSYKFAATLQDNAVKDHLALIRISAKTGHGAGKPVNMLISQYTDMLSFTFFNLGLKPK